MLAIRLEDVNRTEHGPLFVGTRSRLATATAVCFIDAQRLLVASLVAASEPFSFTSDTVEFCAGIARAGDDLVLSFGVSDAAAGLAVLPLAEALALLVGMDTSMDTSRSKVWCPALRPWTTRPPREIVPRMRQAPASPVAT